MVGDPGTDYGLYDKVNVYGDIFGSNIHHNHFGMYTYGHEGGQWVGNAMHDNGNAGLRLSMGRADSRIENNEIGFSGKYGLHFYRGSDTPEPGDDGRRRKLDAEPGPTTACDRTSDRR